MPKPKQFLRDDSRKKKATKHAPQAPETADEYLAVGVDHEEAGEKWRGGDAAKSTRFFVRAIDTYEEGLKQFPNSFDLAYNKARVQYEITQHPKLRGQLPGTLLDLLQVALESSRRALALKQDDADVLFNTAQVLTSLAEALDDSNTNVDAVVPLLEEAIELFQRCLTLQETRLSESQALQDSTTNIPDADTEDSGGAPLTEPPSHPPTTQDEQWATILEPVTPSTLLDTTLAQLETLTLLLSKTTPSAARPLAWLTDYSTTLLTTVLPTHLAVLPARLPEAALTRANLLAALADASFRAAHLPFPAYERAVYDAYRALDLAADPKALSDKADAMLNLAASLRLHATAEQLPQQIVARWGALTQAGAALAAAAKIPDVQNLERIHLARGDAELLRFATRTLTGYPGSVDAGVLLRNAGVFYRGAANQAGVGGDQEAGRVRREAGIKNALVAALGGEGGLLGEMVKTEPLTREVLEEAVGDGLVEVAWLQEAGIV